MNRNYIVKRYLEDNHLIDSHIDKKILYQYRNVIPQRKYVGRTDKYKIFFEETRGSLLKRNYGKSDKVTSWTLLYSDGEKPERITKDFIEKNEIIYYDGYSEEFLFNFLKNNNKRTNGLEVKKDYKRHTMFVTDDEYDMIKDFIKKIREVKDENN